MTNRTPIFSVPAGFQFMAETGGFNELVADLYEKKTEKGTLYGFHTGERLRSVGGSVHGGFSMMVADHLMAMAILRQKNRPGHIATIQMSSQFIERVPVGVWLNVQPEVVRQTAQLIFATCVFFTDATLFKAEGIWKITAPPKKSSGSAEPIFAP
jgi:acyl-coenzyme A thioesterase PaaI-like protein